MRKYLSTRYNLATPKKTATEKHQITLCKKFLKFKKKLEIMVYEGRKKHEEII